MNIFKTEAGKHLLETLGGKIDYPLVGVTKHSFTQQLDTKTYQTTFFQGNPIQDLFSPILTKMHIAHEEYRPITKPYEAFLHYANLEQKRHVYPEILLSTTTFNPATGSNSPVNGEVQRTAVDESFATIRAGAGNSAQVDSAAAPSAELDASATLNQYTTLTRGIFLFNTATLGVGSTVVSATFSLYIASKTDGLTLAVGITSSSPASNSTIANSDYAVANFGSTKFASSLSITSQITTSAYNDWIFNASGVASVAILGLSKYATRIDSDIDNSAPVWVNGASSKIVPQYASETNKPKLTVIYTPGGGGFFYNLI